MKIYVINLERAVERKEAAIGEFERYGIEFDIHSGVDWRSLTERDVREQVEHKFQAIAKKRWNPMSIYGMLACWLSHRNLWKRAVYDGVDAIAVFEDDVRLADETKSALARIESLEQQDFNFDIVFLYDSKRVKPMIPAHRIDSRFVLNLVKYSSMGAVGYVISRPAMKILLDDYPKMNMGIDELMHSYWLTGLKTYVLTPQVAYHGDAISGLEHHSLAGEADGTNELRKLRRESLGAYLRHKLKLEFRKLSGFPSRLVCKYIPQRLAFRKRMKSESL